MNISEDVFANWWTRFFSVFIFIPFTSWPRAPLCASSFFHDDHELNSSFRWKIYYLNATRWKLSSKWRQKMATIRPFNKQKSRMRREYRIIWFCWCIRKGISPLSCEYIHTYTKWYDEILAQMPLFESIDYRKSVWFLLVTHNLNWFLF